MVGLQWSRKKESIFGKILIVPKVQTNLHNHNFNPTIGTEIAKQTQASFKASQGHMQIISKRGDRRGNIQ